MAKHTDLTGRIFGRLTVLRHLGTKHDCANWLCGCRCGWYTEATIGDLNRAKRPKRSCGKCQADERYPSEWAAWTHIQQRCYNPNHKDYHNYGARGITVHPPWRADFYNFLEYIGLKEFSNHTLDRIDNSGNYEPGNVRWTTRFIQNNNKRNTMNSLYNQLIS